METQPKNLAPVARAIRSGALALSLGLAILMLPKEAAAGYFELSAGFSFNNSNYGSGDYEWVRRWSASFGYHFTDISELEVSFQDILDRTSISGYQDTTFHDQTFSAAWVQGFLGRESLVDPYIKLGIGQMDHVATGTYYMLGGASANSEVDSLTEILGVGVRLGLTHKFAIRVEADTYITNFSLATWQDNTYFMAGLSFYF